MVLLSSVDGYAQLIGVLLIFVFVLAITAFVTKYIGSAQKSWDKGKNIEVIEVKRIAPNKFVQIIRAGNHYLVISVGQNDIHVLCELSSDELVVEDPAEGTSFAGILQKFLTNNGASDKSTQSERKDNDE